MTITLAVIASIILAGLAIFQLALALGAPMGKYAWGGKHKGTLPAKLRIGSAISIALYAIFAVVALDKAGAIDVLDDSVVNVAIWVIVAYSFVGILMNAISRSKPERYTMTPIVTVLAVLFLMISLT